MCSICFTSFSVHKRCLKDHLQYRAATEQVFSPKADVPSCHVPSPHRSAHGWLWPALATTSITAGCGRPTARSGYTGQLLVLAEGTGGGNGPDAFARTSRGHGFSRRVERTATQERPVAQRLRSSKRRWEQWVWIPWGKGGT